MKLSNYWRRIAIVFTGLGATVATLATLPRWPARHRRRPG